MPDKPRFLYFLSHPKYCVDKDSEIWKIPLPLSRNESVKLPQKEAGVSVSHGDYFCAVRLFLENNQFKVLTFALAQRFNKTINFKEIEEIRICLEKHGEFYHPARIETVADGTKMLFVLNVALSNAGMECIQREFRLLQKLNNEFPFSFLPKVYGRGQVQTNSNQIEIHMFLAEWLEGFNEFHISRDKTDAKNKIVVWDSIHGNFFLSAYQTKELYRLAALILTSYYNVETLEQIFPWHHAAGDFVIKVIDHNKIELKLETVRNYDSLFEKNALENQENGADFIPEALLVFFLNLSIRMRLDRVDGTGDIAWSDNTAVEGTLEGFLQGLALQAKRGLFPELRDEYFKKWLLLCSKTDLFDLLQTIVNQYNPKAPEIPIIQENLKEHAVVLHHAIDRKLTNI